VLLSPLPHTSAAQIAAATRHACESLHTCCTHAARRVVRLRENNNNNNRSGRFMKPLAPRTQSFPQCFILCGKTMRTMAPNLSCTCKKPACSTYGLCSQCTTCARPRPTGPRRRVGRPRKNAPPCDSITQSGKHHRTAAAREAVDDDQTAAVHQTP